MIKTVIIQPLCSADQSEWRQLWTEYLKFYKTSVPETVYKTTWARLLSADTDEFSGLIARNTEGQALGLTHFLFHRHCWREENVCYLQDLYVAPQSRGLGVGRALIEAVYAAADAAQAPTVYWLTQTGNQQARMLYDRLASATDFMKYNR